MSVVGDSPGGGTERTPVEEGQDRADVVEHAAPAGETGEAGAAERPASRSDQAEVIVGEIPDAHDLSHMLWTARCTEDGLLGHFESKDEAERAGTTHLESEHR